MTTIRIIAKEAGLSKSTVSRYFNNGKVSESSLEKIEKVIKKYNFKPNDFARNLRKEHSDLIGVIIPRFDSAATSAVLEGIDSFNFEGNYNKFIINDKQDTEKEIESIYALKSNKVAGIILIATEITDNHVKTINEIDVPTVVVGQYSDRLFCVTHNEYQAAYDLASRLIYGKYENIIYIGVVARDISVGSCRRRGVQDALKKVNKSCSYFETTFKDFDAYVLGKRILPNIDNALVVCATDSIAVGIMKAARELGKSIPDQISISGFGGYRLGEQVYPTLTTVDYHFYDTGRCVAKTLNNLINGKNIKKNTIIETTVLIKGTTK